MAQALVDQAAANLSETLTIAMAHKPSQQRAMVVFDHDSAAAQLLEQAYRQAAPTAEFWNFAAVDSATLVAAFATLAPHDLVVLVQTQSFRPEGFRIRVELFKRNIKVLEHSNLARISDAVELARYVNALAYDATYYRGVGHALKSAVDGASDLALIADATTTLRVTGGVEPAKINLGDFASLPNTGSLFPIGEIFTEAADLERVDGSVALFAFADLLGNMNFVEQPIILQIRAGRVVASEGATPAFTEVIDGITAAEGEVWVRELGFGMNRAFGRDARVSDVGAFERMCGMHLSLGAKHGVYRKPGMRHKDARYHVDVFPTVRAVEIDGRNIFVDGAWQP